MKTKTSGRWTIQHRHTCGDNGRQFGNKTSGRRTQHPTQVHTCGETMGENGEQWGTREDKKLKRRDTIEARERWKTTRGDKTLRRRTHHPTQTHIVGRQSETSGKTSGRQTHHPTQANVWGDNARQCAQWDRRGEKGRRDLGKADTPSNTGTHVGRQWETRRQEGGRTIQHRHTCGKTMGNIGRQGRDKTSRMQTHHPTQAHMWGRDNGGKMETRYRDGGHANQQKGNTKGDIGWETKGDKTKANTLRMR